MEQVREGSLYLISDGKQEEEVHGMGWLSPVCLLFCFESLAYGVGCPETGWILFPS